MNAEQEWANLEDRNLIELSATIRTTGGRAAVLVTRIMRELLDNVGEFACAVMVARDAMAWVSREGATPSHVEQIRCRTGPYSWEERRYPVPSRLAAWIEADAAGVVAPNIRVWPPA